MAHQFRGSHSYWEGLYRQRSSHASTEVFSIRTLPLLDELSLLHLIFPDFIARARVARAHPVYVSAEATFSQRWTSDGLSVLDSEALVFFSRSERLRFQGAMRLLTASSIFFGNLCDIIALTFIYFHSNS